MKENQNTVINNLEDLIRVTTLAHMLLSYQETTTIEDVKKWMTEPNEFLFKSTPLEVCMRGDANSLIKWLEFKLEIV